MASSFDDFDLDIQKIPGVDEGIQPRSWMCPTTSGPPTCVTCAAGCTQVSCDPNCPSVVICRR